MSAREFLAFTRRLSDGDLALFRVELETDISSAEERLVFLSKVSWLLCGLAGAMAIAQRDLLAVVMAVVVGTLAVFVRPPVRRGRGISLAVLWALILIDTPSKLLADAHPVGLLLTFAVCLFFVGYGIARTTVELRNLIAYRRLIPPPAQGTRCPPV